MSLTKETVSKMLGAAGIQPEKRIAHDGYDIFIGDGFAAHPENTFKRFGVNKGEFPFGAYCTIWFAAQGEDFFLVGCPALYDAFHDKNMDINAKKAGRINNAVRDAKKFIADKKRQEGAVNA